MKALFVTATDTGVGKTEVTCALARAFSRRGQRVAVMKPVETGGGDDAEKLIAATGRALELSHVRPYAFPLPASPEAAAHAAGAPYVDIGNIRRAFDSLARDADLVLVEGAGGLLLPLGGGRSMADLARALALPILIVARPALGTITHTLLTVEAARARGLRVAGVVFSRSNDRVGPEEASTPAAIERHGKVRIFGTLPFGELDAEQHLQLDALEAALGIAPRHD
jgi:dethiobiotin synthetase